MEFITTQEASYRLKVPHDEFMKEFNKPYTKKVKKNPTGKMVHWEGTYKLWTGFQYKENAGEDLPPIDPEKLKEAKEKANAEKAKSAKELYSAHNAKFNYESKLAMFDIEQRKTAALARKLEAEAVTAEYEQEMMLIELNSKKKILVVAEEVEDLWSESIAIARDMFLQVPKSFRVQFQESPAEYYDWLEQTITTILKTLSEHKAVR